VPWHQEYHIIAHIIHITPHYSPYSKKFLTLLVLLILFVPRGREEPRRIAHTAHITPYYSLYLKEYPHISCITRITRALRSGEVLVQDGMQNLSRYPYYSILLTLLDRISHITRTTHIKHALKSRHVEYLISSTLLYITPCYSYYYHYSCYSCAQVWRSASARRRNADLCCMKGLPIPLRPTRMCSAATHCSNTL